MINAADYGQALFNLAREQGVEEQMAQELSAVGDILAAEPGYIRLVTSPALPEEQRLNLLEEAFTTIMPLHLNFLKLLCKKHALGRYAACVRAYMALYDDARQILRATALTAVPMSKRQQEALTEKLHVLTGKTVMLRNVVDPGVMGGVLLRFGGVELDGSIRARLEALRRNLASAIV